MEEKGGSTWINLSLCNHHSPRSMYPLNKVLLRQSVAHKEDCVLQCHTDCTIRHSFSRACGAEKESEGEVG